MFFFGCVGPIHWETYLREAYASLRGVKGSLRGGVLFGVAYAGGYARVILSANLKKSALRQLWLLSRYLAFCDFISFYFGLLWLHFLSFWPFVASFIPPKTWGPMAGAISCLRGAYAEVTQRLRGGSWQLATARPPNPAEIQILDIWKYHMRKSAYASLLTQRFIIHGYASAYAAYATMRIFRYCAYALFFQFPFLHIIFLSFQKKNAAQLNSSSIAEYFLFNSLPRPGNFNFFIWIL